MDESEEGDQNDESMLWLRVPFTLTGDVRGEVGFHVGEESERVGGNELADSTEVGLAQIEPNTIDHAVISG